MRHHPVDITPLTFLDYPKKAACIMWFTGCNLRCPYCYNPELVLGHTRTQVDEMAFLRERQGFLDAVVLSGGEITLQPHLRELCEDIKSMGYLIKIDTNGSNPDVVQELIKHKLIDYVAMDHKMPCDRSWNLPNGTPLFKQFSRTLGILLNSKVPFEIRTTVHPSLLDEADIIRMVREADTLGYKGTYYLQYFFNGGPTLGNIAPPTRRYDRELLDLHAPLPIGYRNFPEDRGKY